MSSHGSSVAPLPIDAAIPALRAALEASPNVVLQAPAGAGKTTRVPLALLDAGWLGARRIVMLEPRRLAARAAARYMAAALGETLGGTVGVRIRGETRVSRSTRIEVVTEGVLTRLLHADPSLDGVGLVIFDEFHERSIHADLGLAFTLQTQELLRPELRVLVMSATLDGTAVSTLLDDAPIIHSEGRTFPVELRYHAMRSEMRVEDAVASMVRRAIAEDAGSILAFLPGAGEIARTAARLSESPLPRDVSVAPLYGDLSGAAQDDAVLAPRPGHRKVVLATSIAETSLTIEGVRVVVDSGLSRVPRFSPRSGMTRLETVRVSRASADQRCGRAGRTAPGLCYRLWSAGEHAGLLDRATPEMLVADLAPLALELALAGIVDVSQLRWLDPPPAAALAQARELLRELGAIDDESQITPHGRAMASLGMHPRLSHMLIAGRGLGSPATACALAALLEERDPFRTDSSLRDADVRLRLRAMASTGATRDPRVDPGRLHRVRERMTVLRDALEVSESTIDEAAAGAFLALAYPDRLARRRDTAGNRFVMRNGHGARLDDGSALARATWLSITETDGQHPEARVFLAAPLEQVEVERLFSSQIVSEEIIEWQPASGMVATRVRERLGAIVLRELPLRDADDGAVAAVLLAAVQRRNGVELPWSDSALRLRARVAFARQLEEGWPDWSDATLYESMEAWLLPHLVGMRRRSEVEAIDLAGLLLGQLSFSQRKSLDRLAPTHLVMPTGSRIPVDYADPSAPSVAVRLQELFGLAETPRVADGRVPVMLQLLSPAGRPVQLTRDLAGFWRSAYMEVRKELRGRYPRHEWPEDPMSASPTRRAKRRS